MCKKIQKAWSLSEETELRRLRELNKSNIEIAKLLSRSVTAIAHKVCRLELTDTSDPFEHKIYPSEQLAYVAGFLDGEGTFYAGGKYSTVYISITNTYKPIIEWLKQEFGGHIKSRKYTNKPKWRDVYSWTIVSRHAVRFCKLVMPYLKEKRTQAELILAIHTTSAKPKNGNRLTEDIKQDRKTMCIKLKRAKRVRW